MSPLSLIMSMEKYYYECNLAGETLTYCFNFKETAEFFKNWLLPCTESIHALTSTQEEIQYWKDKWKLESMSYTEYHLSYYKSCEYLLENYKCMFHGAVFSWNGKAYIFTAPSGTGKSTQLMNWMGLYPDEIEIINGDKPALSSEDGHINVYPTPWKGKEGWGRDDQILELGGIIYLEQGQSNVIRRLDPRESIAPLLKRILFRCISEKDVLNACKMLEKILYSVPVYKLINKGDLESSEMTHDFLLKDVMDNEV